MVSLVAAPPALPAGSSTPRADVVGAPVVLQPVGVPWTATRPPVAAAPPPPRSAEDGPPVAAAPEDQPPAVTIEDAGVATRTTLAVARFAALVYAFVLVFLVLAATIPAVVAGWQPLAVVSGSMQPAVATGSLVLVQPAEADRFYAHPSIVAFADPARPGRLLTHRVVDTASVDGTVIYTTKGDANRNADSDTVAHEDTLGAVRMVVPFVGLPATWLHGGDLRPLALWLAASLIAVWVLFLRVRT